MNLSLLSRSEPTHVLPLLLFVPPPLTSLSHNPLDTFLPRAGLAPTAPQVGSRSHGSWAHVISRPEPGCLLVRQQNPPHNNPFRTFLSEQNSGAPPAPASRPLDKRPPLNAPPPRPPLLTLKGHPAAGHGLL